MVTVRRAKAADVDAICDVIRPSVRWLGGQERWDERQLAEMEASHTSRENILWLMKRHTWWAAWLDGRIVGVTSAFRNEIAKLFVHPDWFHKGVGRALFRAAEKHASASGFHYVRARCFPASASFYEAMGMSVSRREPCRAQGLADKELLVMAKHLEPVAAAHRAQKGE
jgi:GNAT superfamily N-acetyltransferase